MERFRKYLLVTLGFALAGAIGAAFGTGKAEAIVASLVQITNTASSPVLTLSLTDPGRLAYQSQKIVSCSGNVCTFTFPTVPAKHRVVVQHVSGYFQAFSPVPTVLSLALDVGGISTPYIAFPVSVQSGGAFASTNADVLLYFDPPQAPVVEVVAEGGAYIPGNGQVVTLTGYELDCTVAACAPIATQ